jgi:hypothetical protein
VDLDLVILLLGLVLVEQEDDVSCQNGITEFFEVGHLVSHMGMDGGGQLDMTGTDMDLHDRGVSLCELR